MPRFRTRWSLLFALLGGGLLAHSIGSHKVRSSKPPPPLDDWDIPQLVAQLNQADLSFRVVSTRKDGIIHQTAYLTTTDKKWAECNHLAKDQKQIHQWQGTLYCERGPGGDDGTQLLRQWGDYGLIVGPFLFFGDPKLLEQVRAALAGA